MSASAEFVTHESTLSRRDRFLRRFGELMTCNDLAVELRYKSAAAVKKAHSRGTLPVELFRLPKRQELFAATLDVVALLDAATDRDKRGQFRTKEDAMT